MEIVDEPTEGLKIIHLDRFNDVRGSFTEGWNKEEFARKGLDIDFYQDNYVHSRSDVIRGLHYQTTPHEQGKLITCLQGTILDVAVDLRPRSNTFGKHFTLTLSEYNNFAFWIPAGFAHGYGVLSDKSIVSYKCDALWNPKHEAGYHWDSPELGIDWGIKEPIISYKDMALPVFERATAEEEWV